MIEEALEADRGRGVPVIVVVPQPSTGVDIGGFPRILVRKLSICHIVVCLVAFFLDILSALLGGIPIHQGIWVGVFYGFSGAFGLVACHSTTKCSVVTLMVFSIMSSVMTVPLAVVCGMEISSFSRNGGGIVGSILLLDGIIGCIIAAVLASITCRTVCCVKGLEQPAVSYRIDLAEGTVSGPEALLPPPNYEDVEKNQHHVQPQYAKSEGGR